VTVVVVSLASSTTTAVVAAAWPVSPAKRAVMRRLPAPSASSRRISVGWPLRVATSLCGSSLSVAVIRRVTGTLSAAPSAVVTTVTSTPSGVTLVDTVMSTVALLGSTVAGSVRAASMPSPPA
jgi:hypothetical protein